jgi:hypothetical protein
MTGWQRIGVVVSVLWLIGFPIYLVVHSSMNAGHLHEQCLKSYLPDLTSEEKHETCWHSSHIGAVTWKTVGYALIAGNSDTVALWPMMFGPVALLWSFGVITLGTVRWIRRRLTEKGPSH